MTDYFAILGLPRKVDVDEEAIRRQFKEASREAHPDAGGEAADFALLNEAQSTLLDPALRLRHWMALEFPGEKVDTPLSPSLAELFQKTGETLQNASQFLVRRKKKASKLALALLPGEEGADTSITRMPWKSSAM